MSNLNFLVYLNAYSDPSASNAPSLSNFKWTRDIPGIPVSNPISQALQLAPGESKTLFSGSRTLSGDGTTVYSLALKPLTSNTYVLSATSGTLPDFRTPRSTGADATTAITVTLNGPLATFTSTAGTPLNLAGVQVGDFVRIGNLFNQLSQGEWQIIAKTSTSFTINNPSAAAEGPIVLTSDFANQIQIYSGAGVQVGDTLNLFGGFSPASQGTYQITAVAAEYLEFYSSEPLPSESGIMTTSIAVYSSAKSLVYIECDQNAIVTINGSQNVNMSPLIINNSSQPGMFMVHANIYSLSIQNNSLNQANVFVATVE
jgi:hypothetical protein